MKDINIINYASAISDAIEIGLSTNSNIRVIGIGVNYSAGIFGTTRKAFLTYGEQFVVDTPAMENALTGIAAGAALVGVRPIVTHARNDFAFLALDQLINVYSKWQYMFDGKAGSLPVITRLLVGRGWGQGATHSQSIQSILGHFPGLRVVMPANPSDAKGMLLNALLSKDPIVIIEHRNLYSLEGEVQNGHYTTPLEGASVVIEGTDLTIVAVSICVVEALEAAKEILKFGINVEVVDLRSIQPLDSETVLSSVTKTKRLIVIDTSWVQYGISAEILALVAERGMPLLSPPKRLGKAPPPAPVSKVLEDVFYPTSRTIIESVLAMMSIEYRVETSIAKDQETGIFNPY